MSHKATVWAIQQRGLKPATKIVLWFLCDRHNPDFGCFPTRGKWRTIEVLACPVMWRPHPEQIASARRGYEDWWQALDWVRDGLVAGGMLRDMEVRATMPKVRPWKSPRL